MNKLITKVVGAALGITMAIGVGVAVASTNNEVIPAKADPTYVWQKMTATSEFVDGATILITQGDYYLNVSATTTSQTPRLAALTLSNGLPTLTADNTECFVVSGSNSSIKLCKATDTTKWLITGSSNNAARINTGTTGYYWTISSAGSNKFYLNSNSGTRYLSRYGTTDFRSYTNTGTNADLTIYKLVEYVPSSDPDFTIDKDSVNLTLGGSSTTVTATPNEYVSGSATYTWSRTAGDDCVTLTNANTATVTIAPKGTAVSASCTLTIAVTGCTSQTVSVTVKKVSSQASPFTVAEVKEVIDNGTSDDKTGVYVHGYISQVDSYSSNTITYWISDDGTTTGQFEVYKGKGLNNTNFNAVGDLAVGYEVTVYGNVTLYNSSVYEFSSGNYIVTLVLPDSHGVSTSTDGLSLDKDTISSSGGTVAMTTASKKKGTNVVVGGTATSSINGNIVTLSDVETDVTINCDIVNAEVTSLELAGQTTKFALGGSFSFDGTVTGTYDDWVSPHTSETIASGYTVNSSAVDMDEEGSYTVTITYGGASKSYTITVAEIFDNTKGEYHIASSDDIRDGANIVIAAGGSDVVMTHYADGNNFPSAEGAKDEDKGIVTKTNTTNLELVAGTGSYAGYFMMKNKDDKYLYAAGGTGSSPKNQLKASSSITPDDRFYFQFTKVSDTDWTIVAKGGATRNTIRYNTTDSLFSCYASGGQAAVTVYAFKTFTAEANEYAAKFLKANGSSFTTCSATKSAWATLKSAFGVLTTGAQSLFTNADHVDSSTYKDSVEISVAHAVCRYDDAVTKDSTLRGDNEFMGRVSAGTLSYSANVANPISVKTSQITIIIVIASVVSVASVGAYFLLRKRKEQ